MEFQKNLIPNVDSEGLNELTLLRLENGKELECLIDTTDQGNLSTGSFTNLGKLVIKNMTGFKMLCNGPFPKGFLRNLKKVIVMNCGQLQVLFPSRPGEELLQDMEENQALLLNSIGCL